MQSSRVKYRATKKMKTCMVSIDVEEDLNLRTKTFNGVEELNKILDVFDKFDIGATLFATGEVLETYPNLIVEWSSKHEIACHGYYHVPLRELSISEREKQLRDFCKLYQRILGQKPKGFRAVQHTVDNTQLKLLEEVGFKYDSSVVPKYVPLRKYVGYKGRAPTEPYHPSYDNYRERGHLQILEIPVTPLAFGVSLYGTWFRLLGTRPYQLLLTFNKPDFISLAVHPWDYTGYEGKFSKNNGETFLRYLTNILRLINKNYIFMSGEEICVSEEAHKQIGLCQARTVREY